MSDRGYGYLQTTAKSIRRNRPLSVQKQLARNGENPATGKWWPYWKPWTHMTDRVRSIMSRFSKGPNGTGARWGKVGGKAKSAAKTLAARQNGRKSTGRVRHEHATTTASVTTRARFIPVSTSTRNGPVGGDEPRPRAR